MKKIVLIALMPTVIAIVFLSLLLVPSLRKSTTIEEGREIKSGNIKNVEIDNEKPSTPVSLTASDAEEVLSTEIGITDIFPLKVSIGMSIEELRDRYPDERFTYPVHQDSANFARHITGSKFWDTLHLHIKENKVHAFVFSRGKMESDLHALELKSFNDAVENTKSLLGYLKQQLGLEFERKVAYFDDNVRSPMYVWKRENDAVVFLHTPIVLHEQKGGEPLMIVLPSYEPLDGKGQEKYQMQRLYRIVTDSLPEDEKLWLDAIEEE